MSVLSKAKKAISSRNVLDLREERRELERSHRLFEDRALACVDATVAYAAKVRDELLLRELGTVQAPFEGRPGQNTALDLVLWLDGITRLGEPWKQAVKAAAAEGAFSSLSFKEFQKRLTALNDDVEAAERAAEREVIMAEIRERQALLGLGDDAA